VPGGLDPGQESGCGTGLLRVRDDAELRNFGLHNAGTRDQSQQVMCLHKLPRSGLERFIARNLVAELVGKHCAVTGDLSGISGDRSYSPAPKGLRFGKSNIQNTRSPFFNLGTPRLLLSTPNCGRKAKFSKAKSQRSLRVAIIKVPSHRIASIMGWSGGEPAE
jgi:hypothetical protein